MSMAQKDPHILDRHFYPSWCIVWFGDHTDHKFCSKLIHIIQSNITDQLSTINIQLLNYAHYGTISKISVIPASHNILF